MKLFVPLNPGEFDRLAELAVADRRRPQDQAAVLLSRALQPDAGAQPPRTATFSRPSDNEGGA